MQLPTPPTRSTVEEYLRLERQASERHVYLDGAITAMAGESERHGQISINLSSAVHTQLRGKPCAARTKDTKVRSGPAGPRSPRATRGLFSYPDVVVFCGPADYYDERRDVLLNPTAIFAVLSPSTELFDRGEKFHRFQLWNPTLREYVLVAQDRMQVELYSRCADGTWSYRAYRDLGDVVEIASIGAALRLADIYERLEFPPAEPIDPAELAES